MSNNNILSAEFQAFDKVLESSSSSSGSSGNGALGLTTALIENADAIQNYVNKGLMSIQESIITLSTNISNEWIKVLEKDQAAMNANMQAEIINKGTPDAEAIDQQQMTVLSAQANLDNTNYNTQTTTRNGYTDGLSQNMQNTNDTTSNDYQMIESSTVSVIQNMARIIG